jgi:hypothetical protein
VRVFSRVPLRVAYPLRLWFLQRVGSTDSYDSSPNRSLLCFSGLFLLSGITRVFAGAPTTFRASRRASAPLFNFFFRLRFISTLFPGYLVYRPPTLIDRLIRIRKRSCIRIGNVNRPKRLPPNFMRSFSRRPNRIVK